MNILVPWDPFRTRWNPSNDREDLERRVATMLGTREAPGHGGKEALTVENEVLAISGERTFEKEEKGEEVSPD